MLKEAYKNKAMIEAGRGGYNEIIKLLIHKGISVNAEGGEYKTTALFAAARGGHTETVRLLIDKGIKVNTVAKGGISALSEAKSSNHKDTYELLLKASAAERKRDTSWATRIEEESSLESEREK
jgi:ankyrin repeat protein